MYTYQYMNSTFYVWKENQEAYAAVEKKQELVNKLLRVYFQKQDGRLEHLNKQLERVETHVVDLLVEPEKFVPRAPDPETGYPCCTKARPCKHWQWDGNKSAYVNILTGKEREAVL